MNPFANKPVPDPLLREARGPGEDTLRLIASLPAPQGLSDRVQAELRAAPRVGRLLTDRGPLRPPFGWMYSGFLRGAAAAAIVGVVAGGGWRIYSRVQPAPSPRVEIVPAPVSPAGNGFSNAGARRVPQTLDGPLLSHPIVTRPEINVVQKVPAQPTPRTTRKKRMTHSAAVPLQ